MVQYRPSPIASLAGCGVMARRCQDIDFASRSSSVASANVTNSRGRNEALAPEPARIVSGRQVFVKDWTRGGKSLYQVARTTNVSSRHENCQGERRASRAGCTLPVALLPGPVWCKDCVSCILYRCRLLAELRQGDIAHWSASKGLKVKGLPSRRERPYGAHVETTQPSESTT